MKFKVGDKVFDMGGLGAGVVKCVHETEWVLVKFEQLHKYFRVDGKSCKQDKFPCLVTANEARARGFDVPKKVAKKKEEVWLYYYPEDKRIGSFIYYSEEEATMVAGTCALAVKATLEYEVEE